MAQNQVKVEESSDSEPENQPDSVKNGKLLMFMSQLTFVECVKTFRVKTVFMQNINFLILPFFWKQVKPKFFKILDNKKKFCFSLYFMHGF